MLLKVRYGDFVNWIKVEAEDITPELIIESGKRNSHLHLVAYGTGSRSTKKLLPSFPSPFCCIVLTIL
jgi:hypothetical protein